MSYRHVFLIQINKSSTRCEQWKCISPFLGLVELCLYFGSKLANQGGLDLTGWFTALHPNSGCYSKIIISRLHIMTVLGTVHIARVRQSCVYLNTVKQLQCLPLSGQCIFRRSKKHGICCRLLNFWLYIFSVFLLSWNHHFRSWENCLIYLTAAIVPCYINQSYKWEIFTGLSSSVSTTSTSQKRMLLISVIGAAPRDSQAGRLHRECLFLKMKLPSWLKRRKKKREKRERGEQFPVGILTWREPGQPCLPLLQLPFSATPWPKTLFITAVGVCLCRQTWGLKRFLLLSHLLLMQDYDCQYLWGFKSW